MIGDGIKINHLHSYKTFGVLMKTRNIGIPAMREIRDSVPFMNGSYDFSDLYGEESYDNRKLQYVFNYKRKNKKSVNEFSIQFMEWLAQRNIEIYDDSIEGYHFIGTGKITNFKDSEKVGTIDVEFTCYPFKIANSPTIQAFSIERKGLINVYNDGFHRVIPTVYCENETKIISNDITFTFSKGTNKDESFQLRAGENELEIDGSGYVRFEFYKEVL